jgi:hypothetical protein
MSRSLPVGVDAEQINDAIERLVLMAVAHGAQTSCSEVEQAKVRLALGHCSKAMQALVDDAHALMVDSLTAVVVELLNGCVYGVEES